MGYLYQEEYRFFVSRIAFLEHFTWGIPGQFRKNAEKPKDQRIKSGKYIKSEKKCLE